MSERMAPSTEAQMNRGWFELHKHLTNEEMLAHGLIDRCDLIWVEALRQREMSENIVGQIELAIHAAEHDGYLGDKARTELATLYAENTGQTKQIETIRAAWHGLARFLRHDATCAAVVRYPEAECSCGMQESADQFRDALVRDRGGNLGA